MDLGNNMEQNIDNEMYEAMARDILHRPGYFESLVGGMRQEGHGNHPNFIQNMLQNAITNRMEAAEAEEMKRRSMPEWAKYYEFQSWLENVNMRAGDAGEKMEDSNMHNANGNINMMDEGQSGEDVEEEMDVKMPAADANVEPLNKKARSDTSEEQNEQTGEEREDEDDQFDINLDNLHKDDNLQRQLDILGPYLFNKKGMVQMGYPHSFFWRALWSVEEHHDVHFMAYRLRHFGRWDRENVSVDVPVDDPWRWKTVLYFPGKFASHDAKCAWAGLVVEESQGNELRPSFDTSWPRDVGIPGLDEVGDVISDILLACAPEKLQVCLYIDRSMINSFLTLAVVQEEVEERWSFSSRQTDEEVQAIYRQLEARRKQPGLSSVSKFLSSPYLRKDSPIEITEHMNEETLEEQLDLFKKWLKNDSPTFGTIHKEPILAKVPPKRFDMLTSGMMNRRSLLGSEKSENDLVLLATCPNVSNDSDTGEVLDDMCEKLGLHSEIVGIQAAHSRNKEIHSYAYIARDKIGGNIHYPDFSAPLDDVTDEKDKEPCTTSVSFTWTSTERLTQDHIKRQQYKQAFETEFVKRAEVRKEASGGRLTFILWPRDRSEEEDGYFSRQQPIPITNENAHIIWLPGDYESMEEKAFDMFLGGGGGGGGLRFTRTHDGNLFWQSVMSYFSHHVVYHRDACLLYDDSYEDGDEREYTTIPNEHSLKMLHLLIITRAFIMADGEMFDHEYTEEEIKTFFDKFCGEWRRVLLQSDDTLGLGLTEAFNYARQTLVSAATSISAHSSGALNDLLDFQALFEGCYQENTPTASREGLYALLGFHGTWLEEKLNDWKNDGSNWEQVEDFGVSLVPNDDEEDDDNEDIEDEEEMEEDDGEMAEGNL